MQQKNNENKSILDFFKGKKKFDGLIIIGIIAIMAAIYFSGNIGKEKASEQPQSSPEAAAQSEKTVADEEKRLKQVLSCIEGAGQVEVMITYDSTPEIVPAINKDTQVSTTNENTNGGNREQNSERYTDNPVTIQNNGVNEPLIITQKRPEVIGVIVVAQGAYDFNVRMNLLNAVHTALNVPVDIIDVFTMDQENNFNND